MICKVLFRTGLCLFLLTIASCETPEKKPSSSTTIKTDAPKTQTKETLSNPSEVVISFGNEKLTKQQAEWMQPGADDQRLAELAKWWLDNELLYAEAQRRKITDSPKIKFLSELMRKQAYSKELGVQVQDAVKLDDTKLKAYYEENKATDPMLNRPALFSFSHIKTKTVEDAQKALDRIKAGEDMNSLARELSIHPDGAIGGMVKKDDAMMIQRIYGVKLNEALLAAKEGELIGPVKNDDGTCEVARLDNKTEPQITPFETVKEQLRARLERTEKGNAFKSLLDSLRKNAADKVVKSPRIIEAEKSSAGKPAMPGVRK
jgi:peptidyl-prolyl cis-trans isomerase C